MKVVHDDIACNLFFTAFKFDFLAKALPRDTEHTATVTYILRLVSISSI